MTSGGVAVFASEAFRWREVENAILEVAGATEERWADPPCAFVSLSSAVASLPKPHGIGSPFGCLECSGDVFLPISDEI